MTLIQLILSFMQVGLFSVGGGYAAIPLIQAQVVEQHGWLSLSTFTDLITIAEMTPGPIAVNTATFVGLQVAGVPGAILATMSCILPSCLIVSVLALVYKKYRDTRAWGNVLSCLRPAVVALIGSAGLSIFSLVLFAGERAGIGSVQWAGVLLFAAAFFALRKWKLSSIVILCGCGVMGLLIGLVTQLLPAV